LVTVVRITGGGWGCKGALLMAEEKEPKLAIPVPPNLFDDPESQNG
jgi:hypothetical protein